MSKLHVMVIALAGAAVAHADGNAGHKGLVDKWQGWASSAKGDLDKPGGPPDSDIFKWCLKAYDDAITGGVAPTEQVKVRDMTGTIEEINAKVCKAGMDKFTGDADKRWAPYRKVLKNDKLEMLMKDFDAIALPGGQGSDDPKKLAEASVWFVDTSPPETCSNGSQRHRLHRYQFDGQQKLAKTSDKEYCGAPPSSAYH